MKKIILIIMMIVTASLQSYAGAPIAEEVLKGQDGGGGGVIKRDGMYLTFGSAKVKIGAPQQLEQVPGLDLLIAVLDNNQKSISPAAQGKLISAVLPSESRRYFKIDTTQLDTKTYANLIREYAKLLKNQVDPNDLYLAAITIAEDTFLLPPFFQLKVAEQAAILFHESLWIVKPSITYDELVRSEVIMQSHIEKYGTQPQYNSALLEVIGNLTGAYAEIVTAAMAIDVEMNSFSKYKLPLENLHYDVEKYRWAGNRHRDYTSNEKVYIFTGVFSNENGPVFLSELRMAIQKYPDLKFLKLLHAFRNKLVSVKINYIRTNTRSIRQATAYEDLNEYNHPRSRDIDCATGSTSILIGKDGNKFFGYVYNDTQVKEAFEICFTSKD